MRVNHPPRSLLIRWYGVLDYAPGIDFVLVCLGNYRAEIKRVRAGMV